MMNPMHCNGDDMKTDQLGFPVAERPAQPKRWRIGAPRHPDHDHSDDDDGEDFDLKSATSSEFSNKKFKLDFDLLYLLTESYYCTDNGPCRCTVEREAIYRH